MAIGNALELSPPIQGLAGLFCLKVQVKHPVGPLVRPSKVRAFSSLIQPNIAAVRPDRTIACFGKAKDTAPGPVALRY